MAYSLTGMYIGTDSLGGYTVPERLTAAVFHTPQPMSVLRQFLSIRDALGKNAGDTVFRNRIGNLNTGVAAIAESAAITITDYATLSQATATVTEFAGAGSFTQKLENLANVDINSEIVTLLRNAHVTGLDKYLYTNVWNVTYARYCGTATDGYALTTNGTVTATATSALNSYHIRKMKLLLEKKFIRPAFADGTYGMIVSLDAADNLYADSDWKNAQLYEQTKAMFTGYLGSLWGVSFFKESNALTSPMTNNTLSGEGFMFGAGYGTEDTVIPPEIRIGSYTDFGRTVSLASYEMTAFGTLWNLAATYACIKWDSA